MDWTCSTHEAIDLNNFEKRSSWLHQVFCHILHFVYFFTIVTLMQWPILEHNLFWKSEKKHKHYKAHNLSKKVILHFLLLLIESNNNFKTIIKNVNSAQ